ncbi:MAG: DNA polymerase III subunit delta [Parachlamydiaceae bacterium]|nr:DNA polymerase III subunit delta [Parachlamydiaceae bacterium]
MKFNNLRAFEKHLASAAPNHFCQLYFILGKEAFERRLAFDKLKDSFFNGKKNSSLGLQTFEADRLTIDELMNELNAGALFAEKRIVVIQDADKLDKPIMTRLEAYFEKPNSSICLVISAAAINHSTNFYKKGEKIGIVFELVEERTWEKEQSIHNWIGTFLAAEGIQIAQTASQRLVKLLGTQQSQLYSELQKLICYIGDRKGIQIEDVSAIVSSTAVETGWQLGESIFRRDTPAALRISKGMLLDGVPFILMLRQLRSQFQTGLQIAERLSKGGSPADIAKQFIYMKGAILDRNINMAQGYGLKRYIDGLLNIDAAELQSKNSADPELLAELIIIKLTG